MTKASKLATTIAILLVKDTSGFAGGRIGWTKGSAPTIRLPTRILGSAWMPEVSCMTRALKHVMMSVTLRAKEKDGFVGGRTGSPKESVCLRGTPPRLVNAWPPGASWLIRGIRLAITIARLHARDRNGSVGGRTGSPKDSVILATPAHLWHKAAISLLVVSLFVSLLFGFAQVCKLQHHS